MKLNQQIFPVCLVNQSKKNEKICGKDSANANSKQKQKTRQKRRRRKKRIVTVSQPLVICGNLSHGFVVIVIIRFYCC